MQHKPVFTLKKLVLALALTGYAMGSAYAVLTPGTGTIIGTAPVLRTANASATDHSVDFSSTLATAGKLSTGDTITMSYIYTDAEGDGDASTAHVRWYFVKGAAETEITTNITNTAAPSIGGTGKSALIIPAAAIGADAIKVTITEYSASGDPIQGTQIVVPDTSDNDTGGETEVPEGPIIPGGNVVPGIYLSADTTFTNNLIGNTGIKLDVGKTYVFKLWDSPARTTDLTSTVTYNWRLLGTSATDGKSAPAGGFVTNVRGANFTVPKNDEANGKPLTGSNDGAQGFQLAVDYN